MSKSTLSKSAFLTDFLILIATTLSIFLFIPIFHVNESPAEFTFLNGPIFLKLTATLSIITFIIPFILIIILHAVKLQRISRSFCTFLLTWVILTGYLFPLVKSDGMINATETVLSTKAFIIAFLIASTCAAISFTKLAKLPLIFCLVLSLITITPAFPTFMRTAYKPSNTEAFLNVSKDRNIFVIGFDGMPSTPLREILRNKPEIAQVFKDFIFFSNAVSQAPATRASLRSELFGNQNYHALGSTDKEVEAKLNYDNLLINNVKNAFTYNSTYNSFNLNKNTTVTNQNISGIDNSEIVQSHFYWIELLLARIGTPTLVKTLNSSDGYNSLKKKLISAKNNSLLTYKLDNYAGPKWKRALVHDKKYYDEFVTNLSANETGLAIRYLHFRHSHYPVDFDITGQFRSNNAKWHHSNQNYMGLIRQGIGELTQFKEFLDKLKELGIYDNSLIVFKGDHGKPAYYYDFIPNGLRINGNNEWGVDRYMPFLMIKDFGRKKPNLTLNNDLVTLPDLAKTLCVAAKVETVDCSEYIGLNLLGNYKLSDSPKFYIEVVNNARSNFKFENHHTVELSRRNQEFWKILKSSNKLTLNPPK